MSEVPVWICELKKISTELGELTVGDRFGLDCHGDIAVAWTADRPVTKFAKPEQEHSLDVLEAPSLKPQSVQLIVTGYRAGEHTPDYVRVMQGDRGFEFEKPKWKITSVLDPKEQPPKPVPSLGPLQVGMPAWLPVTLIGSQAFAVVLVAVMVWRWIKRRRFKATLKKLETALPPIREFYKQARTLRRRLEVATDRAELPKITRDLNHQFRLMLTREFRIPALEGSDRSIAKALERKRRPLMKAAGEPLKKALRELTRLGARHNLNEADVDQMLRMTVDTAERLDRGAP